MIHTKTPAGTYDENDYWTVSYIDVQSDNPDDHKEVVREYGDVDNAYEDYCSLKKKWWVRDCTYQHHRR
ncbi:hypothetical protein [Pseudoneobacillus sp. C159]